MRKRLTWTLAVATAVGLLFAGIASASKPVVVKAGNLVLTFNGGFTPTKLSKTKLTPIHLNVSGKIKTADGSKPPPLTSFVLETDKNGAIDAKGVPTCKAGKLEARTTKDAERVCKPAIIGKGTTDVEVEFAESKPIMLHSQLLIFNGGISGGTTTLLIHAYLSNPVTSSLVTTVKVKKVHNGRYGLKSVATIPKIANYAGSVTNFNLTITRHGYLLAKCPDGHIDAKGKAVFREGPTAEGSVSRPCTGTR
jgi:hypothetical protein